MTGGWTWFEWHSAPLAIAVFLTVYASARSASFTRIASAGVAGSAIRDGSEVPRQRGQRAIDLEPRSQDSADAVNELIKKVQDLEIWKEKAQKELAASYATTEAIADLIMYQRQMHEIVRQQRHLHYLAKTARFREIGKDMTAEQTLEKLQADITGSALKLKNECGVYDPVAEMNKAISDANFDLWHHKISIDNHAWAVREHQCERLQRLAEDRQAELEDSLARLRRWLMRRGKSEVERRYQAGQA
jgi:hypothetical protein